MRGAPLPHTHPHIHATPALQGVVCGVLYYFPYENDRETVPECPAGARLLNGSSPLRGLTQAPALSQLPRATQRTPKGAKGEVAAADSEEEEEPGEWVGGGVLPVCFLVAPSGWRMCMQKVCWCSTERLSP